MGLENIILTLFSQIMHIIKLIYNLLCYHEPLITLKIKFVKMSAWSKYMVKIIKLSNYMINHVTHGRFHKLISSTRSIQTIHIGHPPVNPKIIYCLATILKPLAPS